MRLPWGLGWIVEADSSGSCDSLDRTRLRAVLRKRVNAGGRWRLIGKWLRAGVMAEGVRSPPATGVVPGGVSAPVLATIVLPHGLEEWCERAGRPRRQGRGVLMRCAADLVMGGALEADARKSMAVWPQRFARCGRTIHPTQTALVSCRKPNGHQPVGMGTGPCDLLGLPHDWTTSRQGSWVIKRRTARKRLRRTKPALWRGCRTNRPAPLQDQYQRRSLKLRGHCQYDGMRGNCRLLEVIHHDTEKAWRYGLSRRSSKRAIRWEKFQ
jgi:RNA-directed DNA polymerase